MNLNKLLVDSPKDIDTKRVLSDRGSAVVMRIKAGSVLKEHQSVSQAILVLISGNAVYEEESREVFLVHPMDVVEIPPHVTHKVTAKEDSLFLLIH